MNHKLIAAERGLLELLPNHPEGLTMQEIIDTLSNHEEAELRAAVWTLRSERLVSFNQDKLLIINTNRSLSNMFFRAQESIEMEVERVKIQFVEDLLKILKNGEVTIKQLSQVSGVSMKTIKALKQCSHSFKLDTLVKLSKALNKKIRIKIS